MKWIIVLDDHQGTESTLEIEGSEARAKKAAQELFDQYRYDTGREYDNQEDLPLITVYKIEKSFSVDIFEHYTEQLDKKEKRLKKQLEDQEREQFERLQEKFGKK